MAFGHLSLDGRPPQNERQGENPLKHAVTTAATVLGCLLGIAQTSYWCGWLLDALHSYWMRHGERQARRPF